VLVAWEAAVLFANPLRHTRSTGSAADRSALFVGFPATMAGSDLLTCVVRTAHARVSDHAGFGSDIAISRPSMLPSAPNTASAFRFENDFRGSVAGAHALPRQRFACHLTMPDAWQGVSVVRYAFTVRDSHPLLLAGLPAHIGCQRNLD
jgi:hypothetical protein